MLARYLPPANNELNSARSFVDSRPIPMSLSLEDKEKITIERALQEADHDKTKTAKFLGITRATLYTKIKKYNLAVQKELVSADNPTPN